ncbi:hypothetical protein BKA83DRAFT_4293822 [Pisolithus microcarpus]|nr:hypothetical protein BKA83DRAFT_4293822 [Pisolithus microcarpus]
MRISTAFQLGVFLFYRVIVLTHSFQMILISSWHTSPFRGYSTFCSKPCPASGMLYLHLLSTTYPAILQDHTTRSELSIDINIITHLTIHEIFHILFEAVSSIRIILLGHSFKMTPESSWHALLFIR